MWPSAQRQMPLDLADSVVPTVSEAGGNDDGDFFIFFSPRSSSAVATAGIDAAISVKGEGGEKEEEDVSVIATSCRNLG